MRAQNSQRRLSSPIFRAKKAARAGRVREGGVPVAVLGENVTLNKGAAKTHRGGCTMLPHQTTTSMVIYFVEMARTRGGRASAVAPPRVYMNPLGIKVRKVHGGFVYQPPSLRVCSYLSLDKMNSRAGQPRSRLYEDVQKCMDKLLERVEDRLLGLDVTGINYQKVDWLLEVSWNFGGKVLVETITFPYFDFYSSHCGQHRL